MITVNETKIPMLKLDSEISLKARIASKFNTLPRFLYIEDLSNDTIKDGKEFKSQDFLFKIQNEEIPFENILEIKKIFPLDVKEAIELWICYNFLSPLKMGLDGEMVMTVLSGMLRQLCLNNENIVFDELERDMTTFIVDREYSSKIISIENEIHQFQAMVKIDDNILEKFQNTKEVQTSSIVNERIRFLITLNLSDIHILEIFNAITLSEEVPFSKCDQYFKILKDFIPPIEWVKDNSRKKKNERLEKRDRNDEKQNDLILHINYKTKGSDIFDYKSYIEIVISDVRKKYQIDAELSLKEGYIKVDEFEKRFSSIFASLNVSFDKIEENKLTSVFLVPKFYFNSYFFLDMLMNDRTFSNIAYTDERNKVTKRSKGGLVEQYWIHYHFEHPSTGPITVSMMMKTTDFSDPDIKAHKYLGLETNNLYAKVKVNAKTKRDIENFKSILAKMCSIYNEKVDEIKRFYQLFIPEFGDTVEFYEKKQKKTIEKYEASDIFVPGYSRICQGERKVVFTDEKNQNAIKFPRDEQKSEPNYKGDGVDQRYYTCANPNYPLIGLVRNNLSNKDKYPFLPCCFKKDQKNSMAMKEYYLNLKNIKDSSTQNIITTNKFLSPGNVSENLPENLRKFFNSIDPGSKYARLGVIRSPSSFINCLTTALDMKSVNNFKSVREQIASKSFLIQPSKQSTFNIPSKELKTQIMDDKIYFDPKLFYRILEKIFNCNIFIFNENELVLPFYSQNYITNYKAEVQNTVFVIEHLGAESDRAEYPQCEIIVKVISPNLYVSNFKNENVRQKITSIFEKMIHGYALNREIKNKDFNLPNDVKIISQQLDFYGKTRCIGCVKDDVKFFILTEPITPLKEESVNFNIVPCDVGFIVNLFRGNVFAKTVLDGMIKEVHVKIGNVNCVIPVSGVNPKDNLPVSTKVHYIIDNTSYIQAFNKNRKNARYIIDNMIWLFSKYISESENKEINNQVLNNFANQKFILNEKMVYDDIPKTFSLNNNFYHNGKLIVISNEMIKRLMYVLKLNLDQNLEKVLNYHNRKSIYDYYIEISDFDKIENQIILQGENSVLNLISKSNEKYLLSNSIQISDSSAPYFFKNKLIDNNVYLAENCDSLADALDICLTWEKEGYNKNIYRNESTVLLDYSFTLFSYINELDIVKYDVEGSIKPEKEIKILGYKINDIPKFTCLLEFKNDFDFFLKQ